MAVAAEPVLAAALWNPTSHHSQHAALGESPPFKRRKLSCGLQDIDTALDGGLDYGSILCMSGEASSGVKDLTLSILVEYLTSEKTSVATIIDTALSFDIKRLHGQILRRLQAEDNEDAQARAMETLDRLNIMKVFDAVGLTESVAEVRDGLEGRDAGTGLDEAQLKPVERSTIGDSEDDEDELLDDNHPRTVSVPAPPIVRVRNESTTRKPGLLVIDTITAPFSPLLKSNHVHGQDLMTSFMRSLRHLTIRRNLATLLINTTVTYAQAKDEPPSIFASCGARPALGMSFSNLLDTHLLVHEEPKEEEDAILMYGSEKHSARASRRQKLASVVEVLSDRYGGRFGHWAAFEVDSGGCLRSIA
ncbi:hypothetical protein B0A50_02015 [Salinomyces thailandicus]|uniref:DNA recombination and repair protein Rad51-like C-terminal domain-containing protein n=1 Tax=Salinomyces thailandicus TaxID=706561 RepID=A0A4U0U7P1_9PEZI|nr:hypothetical protein B0A50_02015 [Salinomyces thailandica]